MIKFLTITTITLTLLFGFTNSPTIKSIASKVVGEDSVFIGYPVPTDENMLFYVQKSFNQNTVVYTLNIDEDGTINHSNPVNVFWRRYQEDGRKRDLTQIEKTFGYGVKSKALKDRPNTYIFSIAAIKDMQFIVTQINNKPQTITTINGKTAFIDRVYIKAEHIKLLPKVFYVEVFGTDVKTKKPLYHRIIP
ncbi:MAG: DUF4833 domain-containing protein [Flavobacteriales bacterium]|nr:DUF4833 domain-containing protein [Flavobacteriales bacterium]MCB9173861.1 DUF4833 domain-containing protein [Flavobacteriales bacterium]